MKITGIGEFRARSAALSESGEPVIVTRHGKVSGVYVPLDEPDRLPDDLRRELAAVLGRHLVAAFEREGGTERKLAEDFRAHRKRRR